MKRSREPEESSYVQEAAEPASAGLVIPDAKIRELDEDQEHGAPSPFRCTLHPQPIVFRDYDDYHAHYNKQHVNRCHECRKNLPSDHLLSVHIEECHDSFVAARREKGEHTYSCFVEGCDRKCRDPSKRRRHLIDKHMYPPNFFFDVVRYGIDGRQSLLCDVSAHNGQPKGGTKAPEGQKVAFQPVEPPIVVKEIEMQDADSVSKNTEMLKLVPRSITFGRGGRRGFTRSPSPMPPAQQHAQP